MRGTTDVRRMLPNRTEQRRGKKRPTKTDLEDIPEDMLEESN